MQRVRLHHIEQRLLSEAVLFLEEIMLRVRPGNVPPDDLLAGTGRLDVLGVLFLVGFGGTAEQLPDDGPKVVGNALPDQFLHRGLFALLTGFPVGYDAGPCRPDVLLAHRGRTGVERNLTGVGALPTVCGTLQRVETLRVTLDQLVGGLQFC